MNDYDLLGGLGRSGARQWPYEESRKLQAEAAARQAEFMRAYVLRNEKVEPESEITITEIPIPDVVYELERYYKSQVRLLNEKNP